MRENLQMPDVAGGIDQTAEYTEERCRELADAIDVVGRITRVGVLDADGSLVIFEFFFFSRSRGVK
tara:strand:+ start:199 stop:396 length:198 start_codon:yes stop_codon:yes gene_type:complete